MDMDQNPPLVLGRNGFGRDGMDTHTVDGGRGHSQVQTRQKAGNAFVCGHGQ
jgi:hypothetical protein